MKSLCSFTLTDEQIKKVRAEYFYASTYWENMRHSRWEKYAEKIYIRRSRFFKCYKESLKDPVIPKELDRYFYVWEDKCASIRSYGDYDRLDSLDSMARLSRDLLLDPGTAYLLTTII